MKEFGTFKAVLDTSLYYENSSSKLKTIDASMYQILNNFGRGWHRMNKGFPDDSCKIICCMALQNDNEECVTLWLRVDSFSANEHDTVTWNVGSSKPESSSKFVDYYSVKFANSK